MTPAELRALFPITASRAYLFSGGLAPAAAPVRAALDRWAADWAGDPMLLYDTYPVDWERARRSFASVIKADPEELAFTDSTSRGSNLIVQMLDAPPGANVVTDEFTYWSSFHPWQLTAKSGVELRRVPARDGRVHLDDLARAIDARTFALSITHVSWQNGFRHDLAALAELAHSRGALLIVDSAQSAGALDIDAPGLGIDFLSGLAMKWMLGAPGVGFLFVARRHVERLAPAQVGYAGLAEMFPADLLAPPRFKPTAARHELGIPALPSLVASRVGAELLLAVGLDAVERHVLNLSGACLEGLRRLGVRSSTPAEPQQRAGVVGFTANRAADLVAYCRERGVDIWTDGRGLVRIDPHVFNTHEDAERALAAIGAFIQAHGRAAVQD